MAVWGFLKTQFYALPYPQTDCTGATIIITGGNSGLGLEAARHFVRLNAARVIIGCRSTERGQTAKADIEQSLDKRDVIQVWELDLTSFASVKAFASRANELDRLDILINNASTILLTWEEAEGNEAQITVNVLSPLLLSMLVLPILRRPETKETKITPHVVIVSSEGALMCQFTERKQDQILKALSSEESRQKYQPVERYNVTKLLELIVVKKLAEICGTSDNGQVIINAVTPGLCHTGLYRRASGAITSWMLRAILSPVWRTAEMGSRALVSAALAGTETHGKFVANCVVREWPDILAGTEGLRLTDQVWKELMEIIGEINQHGVGNI